MSAAGKLELLISLYNNGFLCKCKKTKTTYFDRESGDYEQKVVHNKKCSAVKKMKELLNDC